MEYTPAIIYMKDTEGKYILVNSRHEELFGTRNEDIKGKNRIRCVSRGYRRSVPEKRHEGARLQSIHTRWKNVLSFGVRRENTFPSGFLFWTNRDR